VSPSRPARRARRAIDVVAVVHLADAIAAGVVASGAADQLQREAEIALDKTATIVGQHAQKRFVNDFITAARLGEVQRRHATLLALGSHGHRRMTEILIGGVTGELLCKAPCSVLIARPAANPGSFPRSSLVSTAHASPTRR
jgi:nucleotide-binding universal stress UspA family protein